MVEKEYIEREYTCGNCIHADLCERITLIDEFSRDNIAYCKGFKSFADVVAVVRCKDCEWAEKMTEHEKKLYAEDCVMCPALNPFGGRVPMEPEGYCHIGRKRDEGKTPAGTPIDDWV